MILGRFLISLANLLTTLIDLYILIIIIRSALSWMGNIPPNQFTHILQRLTDPVFRFVYRRLPFTIIGGFDISPIIIILTLHFFDSFFVGLLRDYARQMITNY